MWCTFKPRGVFTHRLAQTRSTTQQVLPFPAHTFYRIPYCLKRGESCSGTPLTVPRRASWQDKSHNTPETFPDEISRWTSLKWLLHSKYYLLRHHCSKLFLNCASEHLIRERNGLEVWFRSSQTPVFSNYDGSFPKVKHHLISLYTVNSTILKDNAVCESRVKRNYLLVAYGIFCYCV